MRRAVDRRRMLGLFADILDYPEPGLARKAVECETLLDAVAPEAATLLGDFRGFAEESPLGRLEEVYSGFFDLNPVCHPYLGYQLFGENYKRSSFLIGLKERYRAEAFHASTNEIPDRLSIVLRFLAHSADDEGADALVREGLMPALKRMTAKPEAGGDGHDGHAEFDGDTGIARQQLDGHSHGEVLAGGFVLETSAEGDEQGERQPHPYHRALEALRLALHAAWGC